LTALASSFGLAQPPRRIEVYDNSHIQGTNAVGAMIVAGPEGLRKNQYRKFNIRSAELTPGDDFGMMREVLQRRFKRLLNEAPRPGVPAVHPPAQAADTPELPRCDRPGEQEELPQEGAPQEGTRPEGALQERGPQEAVAEPGAAPAPPHERDDIAWPDLVLIDGGAGQLNAARETLAALGITDVAMAAIAKGPDRDAGRETFHMPGRPPFRLPPRDPVLYFVERLRDEAHRFAIGSHRQRRSRDIREAGLQEIAGIGPTRKRALLRHFGTLKAIERASVADLRQVPGVSDETARRIYDFFHDTAR
jgi:excinuclease ABC subunit C